MLIMQKGKTQLVLAPNVEKSLSDAQQESQIMDSKWTFSPPEGTGHDTSAILRKVYSTILQFLFIIW